MPDSIQLTSACDAVEAEGGYHWPEAELFVSEKHRLVYCPIQKVACSSLKLWWAELVEGVSDPYVAATVHGEKSVDHGRLNKRFKLHAQASQLGRRPLTDDVWFRFVFVRSPWSRLVSVFLNKFLGLHELTGPVIQAVHRRWKRHPLQAAGQVIRKALSPLAGQRGLHSTLGPLLRGSRAWQDELTFRHFLDFLATDRLDDSETDLHWRPQYRFLGEIPFHFIGRFESLEDDLRTISSLLGVHATLPVTNATKYARPDDQPARCFADAPLAQLRRLSSLPDYRKFYTRELAQQVASLYRRDVEQFGYAFEG